MVVYIGDIWIVTTYDNIQYQVALAQCVKKPSLKLKYLIYIQQVSNVPTHTAKTVISDICTFECFFIVFDQLTSN